MLGMVSEEAVLDALKGVMDPELGIDVVSMGMIRDVKIEGDKVFLKVALTSPFCPFSRMILGEIRQKALEVPGVEEVEIEEVPWQPPAEPQEG